MQEHEQDETKKRKKPRKPSEILDTQRRYLVRGPLGKYIVEASSKEQAMPTKGQAALMGTHETQAHAENRLGWV